MRYKETLPVIPMADQPKKLHIAVFPWLAFGHIVPFFELSKLIAQKGHKISFISTPRNINRLPKLLPTLQPLVELVELPLPHVENLPEDAEATMDIPQHIVPLLKKAFDGLEESLSKFLEKSTPDWLIYDFAQYWLPPICSKHGILCINFNILSAFGYSFLLDSLVLKTNKLSIYESPNKVAALQSFEDKTLTEDHAEVNESGVSDVFRAQEALRGAYLIAVRSCMEIEAESLKFLEALCKKPILQVGLLPPSLQFGVEDSNDENWDTILEWLDKQEERSVIYVAFGSEVALNEEDFTEIAMGLELSGLPFFWALKKQNSPVIGSGLVESHEWIEKRSNRMNGVVWRTWAPQVKILAHRSIGGFLTHCGWSSVIESLQFGCPLIMLPFQNEQGMVARLMEQKRVGIKVPRNEDDGKFTRDSVAMASRTVILGDEGKSCRSHAVQMSKIFGDKELHQKYVDEFVNYLEIHRHVIKDYNT